jgi:hypothetical protein
MNGVKDVYQNFEDIGNDLIDIVNKHVTNNPQLKLIDIFSAVSILFVDIVRKAELLDPEKKEDIRVEALSFLKILLDNEDFRRQVLVQYH